MSTHTRSAAALALMLILTGCQGEPTASDSPPAIAPSTPSATLGPDQVETDEAGVEPPTSADAGSSDEELTGAFDEREQFFIDQQQSPTEGGLLVAKTPQQIEFIEAMAAHLESQGATMTPEVESIYLALALDMCETSILSGHDIDVASLRLHILSSPLFQQLGTAPETVHGLADIGTFGTQVICPEDGRQWRAAYDEAAGVYSSQ